MSSKPEYHLKTQADAVIYFIQQLDIEMVDQLLYDDRPYQDKPKQVFIELLGDVFKQFKDSGDTFLNRVDGFCKNQWCNYKFRGVCFIGNHSGNYIDLLIEIENGEVKDIWECLKFKTLFSFPKKSKLLIECSHCFSEVEYFDFNESEDEDE